MIDSFNFAVSFPLIKRRWRNARLKSEVITINSLFAGGYGIHLYNGYETFTQEKNNLPLIGLQSD
jgi:hypothetical protein